MQIRARLLATTAAITVLSAVSVAVAADKAANVAGDQALESVDKNLKRDPDNRGLTNAQKRIEGNQVRREKHEDRDADDKGLRGEKLERVEKVDRPERPEKPDRPERAGR